MLLNARDSAQKFAEILTQKESKRLVLFCSGVKQELIQPLEVLTSLDRFVSEPILDSVLTPLYHEEHSSHLQLSDRISESLAQRFIGDNPLPYLRTYSEICASDILSYQDSVNSDTLAGYVPILGSSASIWTKTGSTLTDMKGHMKAVENAPNWYDYVELRIYHKTDVKRNAFQGLTTESQNVNLGSFIGAIGDIRNDPPKALVVQYGISESNQCALRIKEKTAYLVDSEQTHKVSGATYELEKCSMVIEYKGLHNPHLNRIERVLRLSKNNITELLTK